MAQKKPSALERISKNGAIAAVRDAIDAYGGVMADLLHVHPAERALLAAEALAGLRQALAGEYTDRALMPLQDSPLGFATDRPGGYPPDVVLDCAVAMWAQGLEPVGNQWMIIAKRPYVRKEGFERLVSRVAQYNIAVRLDPIPPAVRKNGGYASGTVTVKWSLLGLKEGADPKKMVRSYQARANANNKTLEDNLEGKMKRKALRDLWGIIAGMALPEEPDIWEVGDPDASGDMPQVTLGESERAMIAKLEAAEAEANQ